MDTLIVEDWDRNGDTVAVKLTVLEHESLGVEDLDADADIVAVEVDVAITEELPVVVAVTAALAVVEAVPLPAPVTELVLLTLCVDDVVVVPVCVPVTLPEPLMLDDELDEPEIDALIVKLTVAVQDTVPVIVRLTDPLALKDKLTLADCEPDADDVTVTLKVGETLRLTEWVAENDAVTVEVCDAVKLDVHDLLLEVDKVNDSEPLPLPVVEELTLTVPVNDSIYEVLRVRVTLPEPLTLDVGLNDAVTLPLIVTLSDTDPDMVREALRLRVHDAVAVIVGLVEPLGDRLALALTDADCVVDADNVTVILTVDDTLILTERVTEGVAVAVVVVELVRLPVHDALPVRELVLDADTLRVPLTLSVLLYDDVRVPETVAELLRVTLGVSDPDKLWEDVLEEVRDREGDIEGEVLMVRVREVEYVLLRLVYKLQFTFDQSQSAHPAVAPSVVPGMHSPLETHQPHPNGTP